MLNLNKTMFNSHRYWKKNIEDLNFSLSQHLVPEYPSPLYILRSRYCFIDLIR